LAGSAGTVDLGAAVLTVGDSSNTTFAGTIIGATGSGLIKQGSGSLTLTANNTYVGTTTITSGVLEVKKLSNNTAASGIGQPGTTNAGSLVINGGTLRYSGTGDSTDRLFTMGLNGSTLDVSTGPATFTGGGTYLASGTGARTLTLTGDNVGTLTGVIAESGTTSLAKSGIGRWVITNGAQIYTGSTTISGGTLDISTIANANTSSGIGKSDATNPASKLVLNGGILRFLGSTAQSSNRNFTLGSNGGGFDASGSVAAATLALSGAMTAPAGGTQNFTLTGTQTANNTYSSQIVNGTSGNVTSFTKDGAGKWLLSNANNTYTGTTTVNNGTLALGGGTINNIVNSPTINVRNSTSNLDVTASGLTLSTTVDQTLNGNGTVYGAVTASGAHNTTIAPGNSPGKLTFANAGDLTLSTATTVEMEIGGDGIGGTGTAGTNYDQIVMSSTPSKALNINGAKLKLLPSAGIVTGQAYTLVATSGAGATVNFSTVFKNLDNTPMADNGTYSQGLLTFNIDYNSTFVKVTFTTVPEPSSIGLVMLAAPAVLGRRRRGRRA
jgi:fibronectin-binding autotransporter adhesin